MTQTELNALINSKWLASPLAGETSLKYSTLPIPQSDSSVTQKGGFGGDFKVPLSTSGQPVALEGMNTLFEFATSSLYCHNVGLKKGFIQDESSAIGGYPKGALLWYRVPNLSGSRVAGTYNDAETLRRPITYQADTTIQYYDFLVESMVDNNTANFQSDPLLIDGVNWRALPNQVFQKMTTSYNNSVQTNTYFADGYISSKIEQNRYTTSSPLPILFAIKFMEEPLIEYLISFNAVTTKWYFGSTTADINNIGNIITTGCSFYTTDTNATKFRLSLYGKWY